MSASTHLLRDLAPVPARTWKTIDDEARERLTPLLAARRLADWPGCDAYPGIVAGAVDRLRCGGVDGPYAPAIGAVALT